MQSRIVAVDRDAVKVHIRGLRWALIIERSSAKVEEESLHKPAVLPIWDPKKLAVANKTSILYMKFLTFIWESQAGGTGHFPSFSSASYSRRPGYLPYKPFLIPVLNLP